MISIHRARQFGPRTRTARHISRAVALPLVLLGITSAALAQDWTAANNGLTDLDVRVLAIEPANNATLYSSGPSGAFKSTDGGTNWGPTGLVMVPQTVTLPFGRFQGITSSVVAHIAIDPVNPSTLYAGTIRGAACVYYQRRLFKSTDGGANWTDSISPNINGCDNVHALVVAPTHPNTLYLANYDDSVGDTYSPVVKSSDSATNWMYLGGPTSNVLAVDPLDPNTVYAGTFDFPGDPLGNGILKSTDGGIGWTATGLTNTGVSALAIDPRNPSTIYAAAFGSFSQPRGFRGLSKSVDGGSSWTAINTGLGHLIGTASKVTALVVDQNNGSILYVGTSGSGVYRSVDGGATWTPFNDGLRNLDVRSLALAAGEKVLYAGTAAGVFKIRDNLSVLSLEAPQFCIGALWSMRLNDAPPSSPTKLLGVSNGQPWEVSNWNLTDVNGRLSSSGTFAPGTEGSHSLRVETGGTLSNSVSFVVSKCQTPE